jgi:hypothetical protein
LWLRIRQHLDCRPQLIDQRLAIADLLRFSTPGRAFHSASSCFAADPGGVQFLARRDDNLALIHCCRRLRQRVIPSLPMM